MCLSGSFLCASLGAGNLLQLGHLFCPFLACSVVTKNLSLDSQLLLVRQLTVNRSTPVWRRCLETSPQVTSTLSPSSLHLLPGSNGIFHLSCVLVFIEWRLTLAGGDDAVCHV